MLSVSTYEANWETGVLVTAEAVFRVGFPAEVEMEIESAVPGALTQEQFQTGYGANEAAER